MAIRFAAKKIMKESYMFNVSYKAEFCFHTNIIKFRINKT